MLSRRVYIDWGRGLAVLVMIQAHTFDSWTRAADKRSLPFRDAQIVSGFAAPLFLWLAGVALALAATRATRANGRAAAVDTICRRGLEIFLLAFLFRLQAFIVSPGSYPVSLFRVDILNIMGPAIFAAGLAWALAESTAGLVVMYAALATGVAMVTPIIRTTTLVDALPLWVTWYIRPAGDYNTFQMFPWAGFVFAGAACGTLVAVAERATEERRLHAWLVVTGAALFALGWYTSLQPTIYRQASFWTTSPTWFAIRLGVMMIAFSVLFSLSRLATRYNVTCQPLARFGRSSLFVYWIHVELVYGYATWLWRGRLPFLGTVGAFVLFSAAMYGAVVLRDRVVDSALWRLPKLPGARKTLEMTSDG